LINLKHILLAVMAVILFSGCIVGDVVALPFRVTGAVVNVVAPDIVGDTIMDTGDVLDAAIPF
jgi:hypothetical protein